MKYRIPIKILAVILFSLVFMGGILPAAANEPDSRMNLSYADMEQDSLIYDNASVYVAASSIAAAPAYLVNDFPKTSYANWDQGACGNCWVWAGTGTLAQTLNKSKDTYTPLSVQFFNSNFMNGNINMKKPHEWACTGGFPYTFADIYNTGLNQSYPGGPFAVPWNNVNASYMDGSLTEPMNYNQTSFPKNLITTTPNIGLERIEAQRILAEPYSNQTAAVENITRSLVDGKVIYYVMAYPDQSGWGQFNPGFWANQPDSAIWNMDTYNQTYWNSSDGQGGAHHMILIGYNKTDASKANQYWIIQNSWGTDANRPKGQYKLKMWMDYNATFNNTDWQTQEFWVFNTSWKTDPSVSSITPSSGQTGSASITDLIGTNFASGADVMLKSATLNPRPAANLVNGTGGALIGDPSRVTISGKYAYIVSNMSNSLEIVNLNNQFVPLHEGSIVNGAGGALLDGPVDVAISVKYAIVASYRDNALEIIDISNPKSPVHKSKITSGTGGARLLGPQRVKVSGNYAFVASSGSNALEIVNISNPAAPVHYASLTSGTGGALLTTPYDLALTEDFPYVYVASAGDNALEIVNISNPAAPSHMGSLANRAGGALLSEPQSVTVAGYNAFVTSKGDNALEIVDISNQSAPVHRGSLAKTAGVDWLNAPTDAEISADWKYAYVASNGGSSLDIIDVSDPAAPVYRTGISNRTTGALLDSPSSVALSRSLVYVTSRGDDALQVVAVDTIPASGITVSSSTSISSLFNLTGAPAGTWNVVVTNVNSRFATLSGGFAVTLVPQPTYTPGPGGDDDEDNEAAADKEEAHTGPAGQASVSLKTNELGQTLAPYTVETTEASPINVEVSIPQSTKSLTAQGQALTEVTVTPVSQETVAGITGSTAPPDGAVFAAGGLGIECTPSGATFSQPVTITFTMTQSQWDAALAQAGGRVEAVTIQYYDATAKNWVSLPTTAERTSRTFTTTTKHFSFFAVLVKTAMAGSSPARTTYSWETPTMAAVVQTTYGITQTATPVPVSVQLQPRFPLVMIVAAIASIAVIIAGALLLRRWWIRRQNPALFRKYD